jgi:hypothetical protein
MPIIGLDLLEASFCFAERTDAGGGFENRDGRVIELLV